jgi:hypothetical protein
MHVGRTIAMVAGIVLICGCAIRPQPRVDAKACRAEGGVIQGVGMTATPACVKPYADAGKACRNGSDCQGACQAGQDAVVGDAATGTCQKNTHDYFGCRDTVEEGRVVAGMCWD